MAATVVLLKSPASLSKRLLTVCLVGLFVRLIVVAIVYRGFMEPGREHWEFGYELGHVARAIASGRGFSDPYYGKPGGPTALLTPVYPYLMAGIFKLFGIFTTASALVFLSINCLISAVTAVPIYYLASRCFNARVAIVSAWTWAFFPNAINFSAVTMWYHGLVALQLIVILLWAFRLADPATSTSARLRSSTFFGLFCGFAALTNPVIFDVLPLLCPWICWKLAQQQKRWLLPALAGCGAMALSLLPWTLRNEAVMHRWIPFKDGYWLEVCVGNVNNSLHWWDGTEHPSGSAAELTKLQQLGELRYMDTKRGRVLTYIQGHPDSYALRSFRHFVFLWTGFWSLNHEYLHEEPLDLANIFFLSSLSFLALRGLRPALQSAFSREQMVPIVLVLFAFPLPYYLSHVDPGYRHPLDPLLVVLACAAVCRWIDASTYTFVTRYENLSLPI